PKMEGSGGELEAESDGCEDEGGDEKRIERRAVQPCGDFAQPGASRKPVDQAQPEKREGSGHSAEEKIFQGSLRRADVALVESGEHVERKAGEFQRYKDHQNVLGT